MTTQPVVGPPECAIAIGLPLTAQEFYQDLDPASDVDFAKSIKRRHPGLSNNGAWEFYAPIAQSISRIAAEVQQLGARVILGGRLTDLPAVSGSLRTLTLATHWFTSPLIDDDLCDIRSILRTLRNPTHRVHEAVRRAIEVTSPGLLRETDVDRTSPRVRTSIMEAINDLIAASRIYDSATGIQIPPSSSAGDSYGPIRRVDVDLAFGDAVTEDRCVEFRDGLKTVRQLVDALPEDYAGVLDLTMCNSSHAGTVIKRSRPNCLVVVNRGLASLDVRLVRYKLIIAELLRQPTTFLEAMARVHLLLKKERTP